MSSLKILRFKVVECGHFWAQYKERSNEEVLNHIQNTLNFNSLAVSYLNGMLIQIHLDNIY